MNLTTPALRELLLLSEKRDKIAADLDKVNAQIETTISKRGVGPINPVGPPAKPTANKVAVRKGKNAKRGTVKESVLEALKSVGEKGISVPDLAKAAGINKGSLAVWFYTAGKKVSEIEKVGRGLFRLTGSPVAPAPVEAPAKAKKKAKKAAKAKAPKKPEIGPKFNGQGPPAKPANLAEPKAAKGKKAVKVKSVKKAKKDKQPF